MPATRPVAPPALGRRAFLGAAAGGALLATQEFAVSPRAAAEPNSNTADAAASSRQRFAFVTDVHVNGDAETVGHFQRVMNAIALDEPELVISGGDMTDFGLDLECDAYWSVVPEHLKSQMRHVPGNHEVKYDWSDYANYERQFGERNVAVDVGGLHFLMLDTSVFQLDPSYVRRDAMAWLRETLEAIGPEPSIIVTHHPPMGDRYYFLPNQDEFVKAIEPYPVRGILCGHTHQERVLRNNGLTLLVGKTAKTNAGFYRLERNTDGSSDTITISFVDALEQPAALTDQADGAPAQMVTPVTTIDLASPTGPGEDLSPEKITVRCDAEGAISIRARYPGMAPVSDVAATLYNQDTFQGKPDTWTALDRSRSVYRGQLSLRERAPGDYRVIIRSRNADGDEWREIVQVTKPGSTLPLLWEHRMPGSIQGSMAQHEGLVIMAGTTGSVMACRPRGKERREQWTTQIGNVYNDLAFSPDGSTVYLPASDGLHALAATDGSRRWQADLGAPVNADPVVASVDGATQVIVASGLTMHRIDGDTGKSVWECPMEYMTAGRPAVVEDTVYFGGGDGDAWAVDLRTGEARWRTSLTEGTKDRLTEAPWTTNVFPLPNGLILFSTRAAYLAVDPNTHKIAWQSPGNYMYCPPALIDGTLLAVERLGETALLDPDDGTVLWAGRAVPDARAPAQIKHGKWIYLTASSGLVARIDGAGHYEHLRQTTRGFVYATPVLADQSRVLVHADQDGFVKGFAMPAE